jgi:hypothetical protein
MPSISGMPASVSRGDSSDKGQRGCCRLSVDGVSRRFFDASVAKWGVTKMSYVYAFGGDLCALGGWTVTIDGSRKFGATLQLYIPSSVVLGKFVHRCLSIPPREPGYPHRTVDFVLDWPGAEDHPALSTKFVQRSNATRDPFSNQS